MPLDVFHIRSFPIPINSTAKHATYIQNLPSYMAISHSRAYYINFDHAFWRTCYQIHPIFCPTQHALTPISTSSCISALFLQQKSLILQHCNFKISPHIVTPHIEKFDDRQFLMRSVPSFQLHCLTSVRTVTGCLFCLIQIPCLCSIQTLPLSLPQLLHTCHNYTQLPIDTQYT